MLTHYYYSRITIFLLSVISFHLMPSCVTYQNTSQDLQSSNPNTIIYAYDTILSKGTSGIPMVLDLDPGVFCMHGLQIIRELGVEALPALKNMLVTTNDVEKKMKIICCFGAIGEPDTEVIDLLIGEYKGEDKLRVAVCRIFESLKPENDRVKQELLDALGSQDNDLVIAASFAIAEIGYPGDQDYITILTEIWENTTYSAVKISVASALYNLGWEQVLMTDFLIEESGEPNTLPIIYKAMSKVDDINYIEEFRTIIFSGIHPLIASTAVRYLLESEPKSDIIEILSECLQHEDYEVASEALSQLVFLGIDAKEVEADIRTFMENSEHTITPGVTESAENALFWINQDKNYFFSEWGSYFSLFIG